MREIDEERYPLTAHSPANAVAFHGRRFWLLPAEETPPPQGDSGTGDWIPAQASSISKA
jgi:hypothetical protein